MLPGTEYGRDDIKGNLFLMQCPHVIVPVFILDKKGHPRVDNGDEFRCIVPGIGRKIEDVICILVIFSDLIA
jgi:hypothetical protein